MQCRWCVDTECRWTADISPPALRTTEYYHISLRRAFEYSCGYSIAYIVDFALGPIISGSGLPAIGSTWSWYASEDRRPLDYCSPISDYSLKAALDARTGFSMSVSTEQVARLTTRGKVPDDSDATQTPTNVIASGQLVVCPASRDQASF